MLDPILFENENVLIHSFRPQDIGELETMAADVYAVLSDEVTLKYLPGKRLASVQEAEIYLKGSLLRFHAGRNYLHFIRDKGTDQIIGMIDIITPDMAREHYVFEQYPYFIEFYLKGAKMGKRIMPSVLPGLIEALQKQKVSELGAIVDQRNIRAQNVLGSSGFRYEARFGALQDFYRLTENPISSSSS